MPYNLVPCCSPCNVSKGQRDFRDWMVRRFGDTPWVASRVAQLNHFNGLMKPLTVIDEEYMTPMLTALRRRSGVFFSMYDKMISACADNPQEWVGILRQYDKDMLSEHMLLFCESVER
jgi:hypothetical protein